MASQAGLVSFPAATKPELGRTRASMKAHAPRARTAKVRTSISKPSKDAMAASVPAGGPDSGRSGTAQGPGALMQLRGPGRTTSGVRRQFFFAGTAVGFAGLADRARVTRAEVAFAGDDLRAGAVFLAG